MDFRLKPGASYKSIAMGGTGGTNFRSFQPGMGFNTPFGQSGNFGSKLSK